MNTRKNIILCVITLLIAMPMVVNQVNAGNPKIWVMDFDIYTAREIDSLNEGWGTYDYSNDEIEAEYADWAEDYAIYNGYSRNRVVTSSEVYGVRIVVRYNNGTSGATFMGLDNFAISSTFEDSLDDFDTQISGSVTDTTVTSSWETQTFYLGTQAKGKYVGCSIDFWKDGYFDSGEYAGLDYIRVEILVPYY